MKSYLADLRVLLEGCGARIASAFLLFAASAAMDLACMSVLPVFVVFALSADAAPQLPAGWLAGALAGVSPALFSAGVAALFVARAGMMLVVGSAMAALGEYVRQRVVSRMVARALAQPYEAATRSSLSDDVTAATVYSSALSFNVVVPLLRLGLDILTIVAVLAFVAALEPLAVLVAGAVFAAVAVAYVTGIRGTVARQSRRLTELQVGLTHHVSQALSSPREVRVYGLQGYFTRRVEDNLQATVGVQARLGMVGWFPRALGELTLIALGIAYMVYKAGAGAQTALVVSNLSVLAFAGLRLLPAFAQGMANVGFIQTGRRVARILAGKLAGEAPAPMRRTHAAAPAAEPFQSLELRGVSFRYEGAERDALREVSLALKRGQSAGVVGASGAGKSTLGDLLLGLVVPQRGETVVNGSPMALDSARWWGTAGFVPQAPYIANDTLLRNIAYGVPDAGIDLGRVHAALKLAQLEPVLAGLPKGLDTLLGDQGVRLSGGQRQRVAIARALYYRRDFLVLDEATSALDAETEREVIGAIDALKGNITTFIVAHRLSTLRNCDFVIELRDGAVVDVRSPSVAA